MDSIVHLICEEVCTYIYNNVITEVQEKLSRAERVALTCHTWTSRVTQSCVPPLNPLHHRRSLIVRSHSPDQGLS